MGQRTWVWRPMRGTTAILGLLRLLLPSLTSRTAPDGLGDVCEQWNGHKSRLGAPITVSGYLSKLNNFSVGVISALPQARLVQECCNSCRNDSQNLWLFFCTGCEQTGGSGGFTGGHIPPTCSDEELRHLRSCACENPCEIP